MLNKKNILIIGGSSFVGSELVNKLLKEGYFVISTYYNNKLNVNKSNFIQYKLDLLCKNDINIFFKKIMFKYNIDYFIFSVSTKKIGLFNDLTIKELDYFYKVNISSLVYIYKNFLFNYFKHRENSLLLNIGSICSIYFIPFFQTYCSIKSFQRSIIYGFDFELLKYCRGFKNLIIPPIVESNKREFLINKKNFKNNYKEDFNKFIKKPIKKINLNLVISEILLILKNNNQIYDTDIFIGDIILDNKNILNNKKFIG